MKSFVTAALLFLSAAAAVVPRGEPRYGPWNLVAYPDPVTGERIEAQRWEYTMVDGLEVFAPVNAAWGRKKLNPDAPAVHVPWAESMHPATTPEDKEHSLPPPIRKQETYRVVPYGLEKGEQIDYFYTREFHASPEAQSISAQQKPVTLPGSVGQEESSVNGPLAESAFVFLSVPPSLWGYYIDPRDKELRQWKEIGAYRNIPEPSWDERRRRGGILRGFASPSIAATSWNDIGTYTPPRKPRTLMDNEAQSITARPTTDKQVSVALQAIVPEDKEHSLPPPIRKQETYRVVPYGLEKGEQIDYFYTREFHASPEAQSISAQQKPETLPSLVGRPDARIFGPWTESAAPQGSPLIYHSNNGPIMGYPSKMPEPITENRVAQQSSAESNIPPVASTLESADGSTESKKFKDPMFLSKDVKAALEEPEVLALLRHHLLRLRGE